MLAYRANPSLARKLVRAKLKRPPKKHNNMSCNNSGISNYSSNNSSNSGEAVTEPPPHDIAIAKMANIKHNIDIRLKVTTKKCGSHLSPARQIEMYQPSQIKNLGQGIHHPLPGRL